MRVQRNHVATNVVLPLAHKRRLEELAKKTRITQSEYLREAVCDLLAKYDDVLSAGPVKAETPRVAKGKPRPEKDAPKTKRAQKVRATRQSPGGKP